MPRKIPKKKRLTIEQRMVKNKKISKKIKAKISSGELIPTFSKNNEWWKLRAKHGVDALFTDPQKLLESCAEYFKSVVDDPIVVEDIRVVEGEVKRVPTYRAKPFLISGLCLYLGVSEDYWSQFKNSTTVKKNPDFSRVIAGVESIMKTQKITGAVAGIFHANTIARLEGLRENVDNTSLGERMAAPLVVNSYNTAPPLATDETEIEDGTQKKKKS